jgi:single-strand DNA-binding protein
MQINYVVLSGNVVRSPELSITVNGNPFCRFRFASARPGRRGEASAPDADFFDVEVWGRQAENLCDTCVAGDRVLVAGRVRYNEWEDTEGARRSRHVVMADIVALTLEFDTYRIAQREPTPTLAGPAGNEPAECA